VDFWQKEVEENLAAGRIITSDSASERYEAEYAHSSGSPETP